MVTVATRITISEALEGAMPTKLSQEDIEQISVFLGTDEGDKWPALKKALEDLRFKADAGLDAYPGLTLDLLRHFALHFAAACDTKGLATWTSATDALTKVGVLNAKELLLATLGNSATSKKQSVSLPSFLTVAMKGYIGNKKLLKIQFASYEEGGIPDGKTLRKEMDQLLKTWPKAAEKKWFKGLQAKSFSATEKWPMGVDSLLSVIMKGLTGQSQ